MAGQSPLRSRHEAYARTMLEGRRRTAAEHRPRGGAVAAAENLVEFHTYGPAEDDAAPCEIVSTLGDPQAEYAAVRRGAGMLDAPHRGTLVMSGEDRRDFLNRMVTAELKDLAAGIARRAFWLNRKGRIDADLLIVELGHEILIDVDIHQAAHTLRTLDEFLFAEDVTIRDATDAMHRLVLHGPLATKVIAEAGDDTDFTLGAGCAAKVVIAGHEVMIARADETGEIGLHLFIERDYVETVWDRLLKADEVVSDERYRVRPIGWDAYNIARIEAGTPLFNVDFGTNNLPHESGLLHERVSFTKGCYLGQEVVARMENLGRPKQMLVGLRVSGDTLPIAGAQVFEKAQDGAMGDVVGVVTSSTLSPMLGAMPIAFAMVRSKHVQPGRIVLVNAEGGQVEAAMQEHLTFLPPKATSGAT